MAHPDHITASNTIKSQCCAHPRMPPPLPRTPQLTAFHYSRTLPSSLKTPPLPTIPHPRVSSNPLPLRPAFHLTLTANTMPGKSVVRSWAKRRMRDALFQELRTQGWEPDGRAREGGMRDLKGFVRIFTLVPIVKATGGEVKSEAGRLVGRMLRMSEEGRRGGRG